MKNTKTDKNIHSGHRQRMRERYLRDGNLDNFHDHEVVEMLLYFCVPRKNTNDLAHELLATFGSIGAILEASPQQLMQVVGLNETSAVNLSLIKDIFLRSKQSVSKGKRLSGLNEIVKFAIDILDSSATERVVAVFVDHSTTYIDKRIYSSGSKGHCEAPIRDIVQTALNTNCAGVVLLHCHPHGTSTPSEADIDYTNRLIKSLAELKVVLIEHIIYSSINDMYSFRKDWHQE